MVSKNIQYDPIVVQDLARRLYRRAAFTLIFWPVFGAICGAAAGREIGGDTATVIGAALGVFLGYLLGSLRSLNMKVRAQTPLCQQQIEENISSAVTSTHN